ncbi:MAG: hypothetical protein EBZ49_07545 [Proteobacteria bacterium]|nr:hypothetical protein [Pseudomonadota bacterium]
MGSAIKRINRKIEISDRKLRRSAAQESLRSAEAVLSRMKKECSVCGTPFDPKVPGTLDSWHISVSEDSTTLTCSSCKADQSGVQ